MILARKRAILSELPSRRALDLVAVFALAFGLSAACGEEEEVMLRSLRVQLPGQEHNAIKTSWPGIGCWFMTARDFEPEGYKHFVDLHEKFSGYGLLTTSIRHNVEVTQPEVHDQLKRAAEYARSHGMQVVMDLDVRLARESFHRQHPDEMQEIVRLREIALVPDGVTNLEIPALTLADHYTPTDRGVRPYETISSRLLRVYSYLTNADGIDPKSVQEITSRCKIARTAAGLRIAVEGQAADAGRTACVLAAFTLFAADVFAPHLIEFERKVLESYADVPLAGACKDEWGFPGRFSPRADDCWFSTAMARAYERRCPGHDLVRDLLLMFRPHPGLEGARLAAINHYMEMNWQRNAEVETAFYRSIKRIFGPQSMSATHPTWFPDPGTREEVFKNGLDWWACRRDLAQTDETTPFGVRTALAKKWRSPLWVNMYYDRRLESYHEDLWRHVLGGGRMNFHPVYPSPADAKPDDFTTSLLADRVLAADCRVRLLNYISTAPVNCPVAVVFGHPSALNWAGPGLADVGMKVANRLWEEGCYADLIPSSEIAAGNLRLAKDGALQYGPQRYAAAVLYHPEYERPLVAQFFRRAAKANSTALFRVGEWTRDFEGRPFDGPRELASLSLLPTAEAAALTAIDAVKARGIPAQTAGSLRQLGFPASVMPRPSGECHLLDGTVILAGGEHDVMGDPIHKTLRIQGQEITFDAVGIAAVRLDPKGRIEALAAGGLKRFTALSLQIALPEPADLALWEDAKGHWRGVLHGFVGTTPEALTRITTNWTRLRVSSQ